MLNVAEDHLDWHGTLDDYARDKARVLNGRVAVVGLDDPVAAALLDTAARAGAGRLPARRTGRGRTRRPRRHARRQCVRRRSRSAVAAGVDGVDTGGGPGRRARRAGGRSACPRRRRRTGRHRRRAGRVPSWAGTAPRSSRRSTASPTSTTPRPPTRMPRRRRSPPTRGWCGSPAVCSRVPRSPNWYSKWRIGWSESLLIGRDRSLVAEALSRHAPDVPVVELVTGEDSGVLGTTESGVHSVTRVIDVGERDRRRCGHDGRRRRRARPGEPGDTVLLAPAGASFDQFSSYGHRGDAFASAVRAADPVSDREQHPDPVATPEDQRGRPGRQQPRRPPKPLPAAHAPGSAPGWAGR